MPDFSEILCEEAVFHIISVMGQMPTFHKKFFFVFSKAIWASASGTFRIVSNTLVGCVTVVSLMLSPISNEDDLLLVTP